MATATQKNKTKAVVKRTPPVKVKASPKAAKPEVVHTPSYAPTPVATTIPPPPSPDSITEDMPLEQVVREIENSQKRQRILKGQLSIEDELVKALYRMVTFHQNRVLGGMMGDGTVSIEAADSDGRRRFNPIKNFKISVAAAFRWAKKKKGTADEAMQRAVDLCKEQVDGKLSSLYPSGEVPEQVLRYIRYMGQHFHQIGKIEKGKPVKIPAMPDDWGLEPSKH